MNTYIFVIVAHWLLAENNWSGTIPSEVGAMTALSKSIVSSIALHSLFYLLHTFCLQYPIRSTETLRLSGRNIEGAIPSEIGKLTDLGVYLRRFIASRPHLWVYHSIFSSLLPSTQRVLVFGISQLEAQFRWKSGICQI